MPRHHLIRASASLLLLLVTPLPALASQTRCPGASGYPGDLADPVQIAGWMGGMTRGTGLPPELPVMASLVESGLRNLQSGTAGSVGYFQMLTSVWDQGEYSGYLQQPQLQIKWFIDIAVAVKHGATVRNDPMSWGTLIAEVERIAHSDAVGRHTADDYQARLAEARHMLRIGCDGEDRKSES